MLNISLIGSTGSIGRQTLDIVRRYPDRFKVVGLTGHTNAKLLAAQVAEFNPEFIGISGECDISPVRDVSDGREIARGLTALKGAASLASADLLIISVVGVSGLVAVQEGLKRHKKMAVANKEALVVGGDIIMSLARESNVEIIPIDSEHSAIFQCLAAGQRQDLKRIILTCSGGAFRDLSLAELKTVKASQALKHPNWSMGNKITIDCATLMNKGLELIEARYLFNTERVEAVLHRESIIHSMVEFNDSSVIAQMSYPTMEIPIMYALSHPKRLASTVKPLDLAALKSLSFGEIDERRFPCFALAKSVMGNSGASAVLNAANEIAVQLFLREEIGFTDIPDLISRALDGVSYTAPKTVEDLLSIDIAAREYTLSIGGRR